MARPWGLTGNIGSCFVLEKDIAAVDQGSLVVHQQLPKCLRLLLHDKRIKCQVGKLEVWTLPNRRTFSAMLRSSAPLPPIGRTLRLDHVRPHQVQAECDRHQTQHTRQRPFHSLHP